MTRVIAEGLADALAYFESFPMRAKSAASLAINQTAQRGGLKLARTAMRERITFPGGYLEDRKRLGVTQFAKPDNLEGIITGRGRPTSLARFALPGSKNNPAVRVGAGRTRRIDGAFLVRLPAGRGADAELSNVGLAVRLKAGERVRNKKQMVPFRAGLYLLYGPSIDQIFRSVLPEIEPEILDELAEEFRRQFARLGNGVR